METTTYLILRLAIGASMFGHGLVRLPKLTMFSQWMVNSFDKSMLPKVMVLPFSYALPLGELLVGILLIAGLFTKPALFLAALIMMALIFGTAMIENWEALPSQLIHVAFFAVLLHFIQYNGWALDNLLKK